MEEDLEQMQTRHRKEQRDLQSRITSKKHNATKKTRKGVNDECTLLEHDLKERQAKELAALTGNDGEADAQEIDEAEPLTNPNDLAKELGSTVLTETTTVPLTSTTDETRQPKKRSRQKERLARRAAEQEAEAIAAEEEAANMTDYKKLEKTYMLKEFKANSLVEKEIQPDGHCLFSAVADQLQQKGIPLSSGGTDAGSPAYKIVRKAAARWMENHPDDFAPFLEEPLTSYISKIGDTAEWGGQLELLALANTYNVKISVVQEGRIEMIEPSSSSNESEEPGKLWLAYYRHGYGLGEHYNSLRKET
jgi:OTU domain-containing protein 6